MAMTQATLPPFKDEIKDVPPGKLTDTHTPPPVKPDEAAFNERIKKGREEIELIRKKITAINDKISAYSGGREQFHKQRDDARAQINILNNRIEALELRRKTVQDDRLSQQNHGRTMRSQAENLQKSIGFHTVEEIDARIEAIDHERITSPSITLKEEKRMIEEIDRLKKLKPQISKLADLQSKANVADMLENSSYSSGDNVNSIRDEVRKLREARSDEQAKISQLEAERERTMAPLKHLLSERDELRQQLGKISSEVSTIQSELRTKETEYRAFQARQRNAKMEVERYDRQRNQLAADKKALMDEIDGLRAKSIDRKLTLAMQLKAYLEEQMKEGSTNDTAHAPEEENAINSNEENEKINYQNTIYVPLVREEVQPVDNRRRKKKGSKKAGGSSPNANKSLQLSLSTIRDFVTVGLESDYPRYLSECPATIAKLDLFIEEQESKSSAIFEAIERKKDELMTKVEKVSKREQELASNPPAGWKPSKISSSKKDGSSPRAED